jgi:hypothetical protein
MPWGTAVAQWLGYCATNQKVAGSVPDGVMEFFIDINSSDCQKQNYPCTDLDRLRGFLEAVTPRFQNIFLITFPRVLDIASLCLKPLSMPKAKLSLYRPGQAQRFPGGCDSQISEQSAQEGDKFVSRTYRTPLDLRKFSRHPFPFKGFVDPRVHSEVGGIMFNIYSG